MTKTPQTARTAMALASAGIMQTQQVGSGNRVRNVTMNDKTLVERLHAIRDRYGMMYDDYDDITEAATRIEALEAALRDMPEPYEYLNAAQLKTLRPFIDAKRNWWHRHKRTLEGSGND